MFEMSRLATPVICVVIGEGGSGGALGIGVGDRVAMLEHAYYSVISPEGCAGILWKSRRIQEQAAQALKMTSKDLMRLGVIDDVIREPLGGSASRPPPDGQSAEGLFSQRVSRLLDQPIDQATGNSQYRKLHNKAHYWKAAFRPENRRMDMLRPALPHRTRQEAAIP